ncbi:hypothetical protein AGOR_G00250260 [Albula goreensis]|uniref:RRM domain-containing protein n=1 Tax=Albula goreensis TaxID=1534307 RepID=A0A8T3CC73_9TELE|nr:hypothetical protein AGOR_G00250260 [Albula goreensis]
MSKSGERNRISEYHDRKQSSSLSNGMETNHSVSGSGERRSHHWRSYKLIIDPALTKRSQKLYRYDGQTFSMPNPGMSPVDTVRDPRIGRIWSKYKETDLPVPKFKIDECYVGRVPPKEVTFAKLNDNVGEKFLTDMCKKYGDIEQVQILYNPKNKRHLGIAKVVFGSVRAAKDAVQNLHNTSVMGNIIHVELDPRGENRMRYFQLLVDGTYTPQTLPVGGEEPPTVLPLSLADALQVCESVKRLAEGIVTPSTVGTPLSLDTPSSFGHTPQVAQAIPHGTPRSASATPLSQDSAYSSRHNTPAYKPRRLDSKFHNAYNRRHEHHYVYSGPRPRLRRASVSPQPGLADRDAAAGPPGQAAFPERGAPADGREPRFLLPLLLVSLPQQSPAPPSFRPPSTGLEDISPTPLPDSDDSDSDEPAQTLPGQATPAEEPQVHSGEAKDDAMNHSADDKMEEGGQSSGEDMEISDDETPVAPITGGEIAKGILINSAPPPAISIPPPASHPFPLPRTLPLPLPNQPSRCCPHRTPHTCPQ